MIPVYPKTKETRCPRNALNVKKSRNSEHLGRIGQQGMGYRLGAENVAKVT